MARGYKNVDFHWNGSHSMVIENLGFGKELQRDAAEILYQNAFEYMPYYSGDLSTNVTIQPTETYANIIHQVKYANPQYNGFTPQGKPIDNKRRYKLIHPLATSRWYDVAWKHKSREITEEIDEARLKYRSFNYGN